MILIFEPVYNNVMLALGERRLNWFNNRALADQEVLEKCANVLQAGFEQPVIRDELFLLLIRQGNRNPNPSGTLVAWFLLVMCFKYFSTSKYKNFVLERIRSMAYLVGVY